MKAVFVHLGTAKAEHLWANLKRFKDIFPEIATVIVLDDPIHLPRLRNLDVELFWFSRSTYVDGQIGKLNHNLDFREGFWRFSVERIMALNAWHQENPQVALIHIESDILLLPNFPWRKFASLASLAWLRSNITHDVAAILYSPNPDETKWLANTVCSKLLADPNLTDMTVLSQISNENKSRITILPTLMRELTSSNGGNELQERNQLSENEENFGGIFDSAAIGMWLTGQDPRNHLGWIKRYIPLPESYVDPSAFKYSIGANGCVIVTYGGRSVELFNLHLHSKQLSFFGRNWETRLRTDVRTSKNRRRSRRLSTSIFLAIVRNYLSKNKLFSNRSIRNFTEAIKAFYRNTN